MYPSIIISPKNITPRIKSAIARNICEVMNEKASTKSIGKLRNIIKFRITFIFKINIRK